MPHTEKQENELPLPKTHSNTFSKGHSFGHGPFDFQRLDAYNVARQALLQGDAIAKKLLSIT